MSSTDGGAKQSVDPAEKGEQLEHDIEEIRDNLDSLVGELDHRRHRLLDVGARVREYAVPLAIGAVTIAALIGGGIAISRARRPPTMAKRLKRLREAAGTSGAALLEKGRALRAGRTVKVEKKQAFSTRLLAAAGTAVVSVLARRLAEKMVAQPDSKPQKFV